MYRSRSTQSDLSFETKRNCKGRSLAGREHWTLLLMSLGFFLVMSMSVAASAQTSNKEPQEKQTADKSDTNTAKPETTEVGSSKENSKKSDDEKKPSGAAQQNTASADQKSPPQKTLREERMEALKRQFELEKEDRPEAPKFIQPRRKRVPGQPIDLTFDDIKFDMEKDAKFQRSMITQDIRELHGQVVRLRGYIKPGNGTNNLKRFVFVRDDKECCFGPGAALYDCVMVSMKKDRPTDFSVRPVTIEGKFYLKEYLGPDGNIWAIYRMKSGVRK